MAACFIAGDWGTTHAGLFLCDETGRALDSRNGPGVSRAKAKDVFSSLTAEWDGSLPAVLCGMVGSTLGWREAPYLPCPIRPDAIAKSLHHFDTDGRAIVIVPGLHCCNPLDAPDLMRGEETQILGALQCDPSLARGTKLLCLPGTHTKWALLEDGMIARFLTGFSGELFDILRRHSILAGGAEATATIDEDAFRQALERTRNPGATLQHLLFETRSRQLHDTLNKESAASFLSGLIIGGDVSGAIGIFRHVTGLADCITVIGEPRLAALYVRALDVHARPAATIEGKTAALAGLAAFYRASFGASP